MLLIMSFMCEIFWPLLQLKNQSILGFTLTTMVINWYILYWMNKVINIRYEYCVIEKILRKNKEIYILQLIQSFKIPALIVTHFRKNCFVLERKTNVWMAKKRFVKTFTQFSGLCLDISGSILFLLHTYADSVQKIFLYS